MGAIHDIETMLNSVKTLAQLWHDGYVDHPDDRPIWGVNGHDITVGDVRRARIVLGLPVHRVGHK